MTSAQGSNTKNSRKARKTSQNETPWHMRKDTLELLLGKMEAEREIHRRQQQSKQAKATSSTMESSKPELILDRTIFPE